MNNLKFILPLIFLFVTIIGCSEDPNTHPEDHFEAIGVVVYSSGTQVASILRGVTNDTLIVQAGNLPIMELKFYNGQEQIIEPPTDPDATLGHLIDDSNILAFEAHAPEPGGSTHRFSFHLRGLTAGVTNVEFLILHGGHSDFRSGKIPVRVVQ